MVYGVIQMNHLENIVSTELNFIVMKNYVFLFFLICTCTAFSQVEVGAKRYGKNEPIKAEVLEKFKNATTLFVLPDRIDLETYDRLLKEIWTVNPYKIVTIDDFEIEEMYNENYAFFSIDYHKKNRKDKAGNSVTAFHSYFDLSIYDGDEIATRIAKFDDRVKAKKMPIILKGNRTTLAKFYLYPEEEFIGTTLKANRRSIIESLYASDVFYNFSEGLLKNYVQQVNNILLKGYNYILEQKDHKSQIAELANKTLYIPEYVTLKTNVLKVKVSPMKDKEIKNLFQFYHHSYETISDAALSEAIVKGKELFYLRYVRVDDEKFIQIVNSKTGSIIYRDYVAGFTYNLKPKFFEYLSLTIDEVTGKSAK